MKKYYKCPKVYFLIWFFIIGFGTLKAQTWENLGNLSVGVNEVGFIDEIVGFNSGLYLSSDLGLFRTTDSGNTFTNLTYENGATLGLRIYCVFDDEANNTLYAGGDTAIYKSTDNGSNWTITGLTGTQKINSIARKNGNLLASYGDSFGSGGAYYSSDGFATFTQSTGLPDLRMIGFYTQDALLFLAGEEGVYGSQDNGVTWAVQGTGHDNAGEDVKFIKNNNKIFVADRGGSGLYETVDNGATWTETDPVTFQSFCQVFDIALSNGVIYVVIDGVGCVNTNESIKVSADNGATWSSGLFNLSQAYFAKLGVTVDGCVFTYAPFEDKLYRLCNGPLQVEKNNLDTALIAPNPTNGAIQLKGLEKSGTVRVFNMQGVLLKSYSELPKNNSIELFEFTTGVYLIMIQNESGSKTFKIVKQ